VLFACNKNKMLHTLHILLTYFVLSIEVYETNDRAKNIAVRHILSLICQNERKHFINLIVITQPGTKMHGGNCLRKTNM